MNWWLWTLVGIGGYLVTGFLLGLLWAYTEGRKGESVGDDADDAVDALAPLFFWPALIIYLGSGLVPLMNGLHRKVNGLGQTRDSRRAAQEDKRDTDKQLKALFEAEGWDINKLPKPSR